MLIMLIRNLSKNGPFIEGNIVEEEILDWYSLTPSERFVESQKLWEVFVLLGGDYDPEPDTQSPFHLFET